MRDYPIIDADTHVNVPLREVVKRVPKKYKIEVPGDAPGFLLVNAVGFSPVHWKVLGDKEDERFYRAGAWDPAERIKDMDIDYDDVHVLFGGVSPPVSDRDAVLAYTQAYNDWVSDFCSYAPDRLFAPATIPDTGVEDAIAEVKRVHGRPGICGVELTAWPNGSHQFPDHEAEEPFWSLLEELDLSACVHVGFGSDGEGDVNAIEIFNTPGLGVPYLNKERVAIGSIEIMSHMILGGILDRHPNLRFGCIESGVGWIPFFLEQSEDNWSRHRFWSNTNLSMLPSDYWGRQCFATFQIDRFGIKVRDDIGSNTIMWSSDYPHTGAEWPMSHRVLKDHLDGVGEEEQRLMLCDNAARLWGLDVEKLGRCQRPGPAVRR